MSFDPERLAETWRTTLKQAPRNLKTVNTLSIDQTDLLLKHQCELCGSEPVAMVQAAIRTKPSGRRAYNTIVYACWDQDACDFRRAVKT